MSPKDALLHAKKNKDIIRINNINNQIFIQNNFGMGRPQNNNDAQNQNQNRRRNKMNNSGNSNPEKNNLMFGEMINFSNKNREIQLWSQKIAILLKSDLSKEKILDKMFDDTGLDRVSTLSQNQSGYQGSSFTRVVQDSEKSNLHKRSSDEFEKDKGGFYNFAFNFISVEGVRLTKFEKYLAWLYYYKGNNLVEFVISLYDNLLSNKSRVLVSI